MAAPGNVSTLKAGRRDGREGSLQTYPSPLLGKQIFSWKFSSRLLLMSLWPELITWSSPAAYSRRWQGRRQLAKTVESVFQQALGKGFDVLRFRGKQ